MTKVWFWVISIYYIKKAMFGIGGLLIFLKLLSLNEDLNKPDNFYNSSQEFIARKKREKKKKTRK